MTAATYSTASGPNASHGVPSLAAGASGVYIAAYVDGEQRGRVFLPESVTSVGQGQSAVVCNTVLPQLIAVWQGSDQNNPTSGGGFTMQLQWPASTTTDLTDSTSPQVLFLDEEATVVYLANNQGANTL